MWNSPKHKTGYSLTDVILARVSGESGNCMDHIYFVIECSSMKSLCVHVGWRRLYRRLEIVKGKRRKRGRGPAKLEAETAKQFLNCQVIVDGLGLRSEDPESCLTIEINKIRKTEKRKSHSNSKCQPVSQVETVLYLPYSHFIPNGPHFFEFPNYF